jgi:hypothetical protein
MNTLTCEQVEEHIDLYAADECDAPTSAAIDHHLTDCPICAEKYEESRQLLGLLDLRLQEPDRLRRLHARVQVESRKSKARVLPFLHRVGAVAATLLVTFGLSGWLGPNLEDRESGERTLVATLLPPSSRGVPELAPGHEAMHAKANLAKDEAEIRTTRAWAEAKVGAALRADLQARRPPPPEENFRLSLDNRGSHDLLVAIDDRTEVEINLKGAGAMTVPAPEPAARPFSRSQTIRVPAGESRELPLKRLASVTPRGTWYSYFTEPGEYVLTVRLRTEVLSGIDEPKPRLRTQTLTPKPIIIDVNGKP